ncbi:MAG: pyridoxal phosphate-dependent aminotransferase [bacterium]
MSELKLSRAAYILKGSPMFRLLARVKELEAKGEKIIHFEIGDPDFATPAHIKQAVVESLEAGETHYPNSMGINELRDTICATTEKEYNFRPTRAQVIVTPAISVIYFVTRCVVNPGEEIIVPDPGFSSYYSAFDFIGVRWVGVPLLEKNEFRMNPADIRARITDKTKLIIINSPQNPTGAVMTKEEIEEVAKIAAEHNLYLLTDETYKKMIYDYPHYSPAVFDGCRERTIILDSFSKAYAMTGFRLGWAIGPEELIDKMGLMVQTIISAVPPFIQKAGVAALLGDQSAISKMMAEYRKRRDLIVEGLNNLPGVSCLKPEGAFYVFPNITATGMTSSEFAEFALEKARVALLPGSTFGQYGEGYVRLCYANSQENIKEGLERLKRALSER